MIAPNDQTLIDFFENVYRPVRLLNGSPETFRQYRLILKLYSDYLGRPAMLTDLQDALVGSFLQTYSPGRSPATVQKARNHLCALWTLAAKKRLTEEFPELGKIKVAKKIPEAWSSEQFQALIDSCSQEPGWISGVPAWKWWTAIVLVGYDTGLRYGALMALRIVDVDLERRTVFARAETQKQHADQLLTIHPQTVRAIRATLAGEPRELLFPWELCMVSIYNHFRRILRRAGLPCERGDFFHRIRRTSGTFAEVAIGRGAATEHLGHSSSRVTRASYIDTRLVPAVDVASQLPRPIMPGDNDDPEPAADPIVAPVGDRVRGMYEKQAKDQADLATVPMPDVLRAYIFHLQSHRDSTKTVSRTQHHLERLIETCGFATVADLRPEPIVQFLDDLADGKVSRFHRALIPPEKQRAILARLSVVERLDDPDAPSLRDIARQEGVSHFYVQQLAKRGRPHEGKTRSEKTVNYYRQVILGLLKWLIRRFPHALGNVRDTLTVLDRTGRYEPRPQRPAPSQSNGHSGVRGKLRQGLGRFLGLTTKGTPQ